VAREGLLIAARCMTEEISHSRLLWAYYVRNWIYNQQRKNKLSRQYWSLACWGICIKWNFL